MAANVPPPAHALLLELLEEARSLGFLGPGPVQDHVSRSLAFVDIGRRVPTMAADLGSGGGVPSLVLVQAWPRTKWTLIESNERRSQWLRGAVQFLGASDRCSVLEERAEDVARSALRGTCDLVTARGFATPGPTAECAAALLGPQGDLLVAGPPHDGPERWPAEPLRELGLAYAETRRSNAGGAPTTITRLLRVAVTPTRYPRRTGVPFKRPLF